MTKEEIMRIAYEQGIDYIGVAGIQRFAAAIRSATKEEDARICADLENPSIASCASVDVLDAWANGTFDCEVAIRASK